MAGMTTIEMETMEAIKTFCWEMVDKKRPNWGRRRYEIAKDCLAALMPEIREQLRESVNPAKDNLLEIECIAKKVCEAAVDISVLAADTLVRKLKERVNP